MISHPGQQPQGTQFYVTRRPNPFWEFCEPCEEFLAGPFDSFDKAANMIPIVRSWGNYHDPMGVFAVYPKLQNKLTIIPKFARTDGDCKMNDAPTRVTANWIRQKSVHRCEPLDGQSAPGFEPRIAS